MEKPKRLKIVQRKAHNPSNGQTDNSYTSAHRTLPVGFGKDPKTAEKRHSTAAFRRPQRKPTLALVVLGFVLLVQACRKVQGRLDDFYKQGTNYNIDEENLLTFSILTKSSESRHYQTYSAYPTHRKFQTRLRPSTKTSKTDLKTVRRAAISMVN